MNSQVTAETFTTMAELLGLYQEPIPAGASVCRRCGHGAGLGHCPARAEGLEGKAADAVFTEKYLLSIFYVPVPDIF